MPKTTRVTDKPFTKILPSEESICPSMIKPTCHR